MPEISVIVPCYNAERWIGEAIASVLGQAADGVEIIVVDDGSTDGSAEVVRESCQQVKLVRSEHRGPSHARNTGTRLAKGQFLQYLDADDLLAPGKLERQLTELRSSGADVAYGPWEELLPTKDGTFAIGKHFDRRMTCPEVELFTDFWCPTATYLFRRSIVTKVGGWNEGLPIIQDARFVLDCALRGARFVYCSGVMGYYRRHTSASVSTRDRVAFARDCLRNCGEVHRWWEENGGVNEQRRNALLKAYGYVARATYDNDQKTFKAAWGALEHLRPGYIPEEPWDLAIASRFLGYQRAEAVAAWYRAAKRFMKHDTGSATDEVGQ